MFQLLFHFIYFYQGNVVYVVVYVVYVVVVYVFVYYKSF